MKRLRRARFAKIESRKPTVEEISSPFSSLSFFPVAVVYFTSATSMATSSRSRSSGPVLPINGLRRSTSPSGKFCSSSYSQSSSAFASSSTGFSATFSSPSSRFLHRSSSPTRVNLCGPISSAPSVRFSIDRAPSPGRSFAVSPRERQVVKNQSKILSAPQKRTCMCSPTTHPGSFRCSLHKGFGSHAVYAPSNRLNARRSAMTNSLVRIGTVEGDWVRRSLAALIRPSSHQQKRRAAFQPRPSRLSVMSKADG